MEIFIHLGYPKTGSTYLQQQVFPLIKDINYIGKPFTGDHLPPKIVYTTRAHGWSTTKLKDMITRQTMKQNPNVIDE